MATDTESQYASVARTRPTSHSSIRRRASRHRKDIPSSTIPSSPPFPPVRGQSPVADIADDDNLSPLDPRRFTPTLHASLVSEILALRRDAEGKSKVIDDLEQSLHDSRLENESISENLTQSTKEARFAKHQVQLLEGGSSSALTELAKERDRALENIADVHTKLDQAQRKARAHEEESNTIRILWTQERDGWEGDRRNFERKVHVVEGRLKAVLHEIAAAREAGSLNNNNFDNNNISNHNNNTNTATKGDYSMDPATKDAAPGKESDSTSIRSSSQGRQRTSVTSLSTDDGCYDRHNNRYSVMSVTNGQAAFKNDGLNLAQELAFDEEDEEEYLIEDDGDNPAMPMSPEALPEERPASVNSQGSYALSMKARKVLGLSFDGQVERPISVMSTEQIPRQGKRASSSLAKLFEYRDAGVQHSPPPSPAPSLSGATSSLQFMEIVNEKPAPIPVRSLNTSSPAIQAIAPETKDSGTSTHTVDMVSASCQTVQCPSPPQSPIEPQSPPTVSPAPVATTSSISTQTEEVLKDDGDEEQQNEDPASFEMPIPTIAVHPPISEPPSPRNSVVLPPQAKSVSCQTTPGALSESRSFGIQTEEIRIDTRPVKLPPSLLPSAIPDLPLSGASNRKPPTPPLPQAAPSAPPPKSAKRAMYRPAIERPVPTKAPNGKLPVSVQAYPGDNDDGPLSDDLKPGIRRPLRSSSLFAGFEQLSDEELPETAEETDVFTDEELLNRPFIHYTLRRGKMVSRRSAGKDTLLEMDEPLSDTETKTQDTSTMNNNRGLEEEEGEEEEGPSSKARIWSSKAKKGKQNPTTTPGMKEQNIRRTAMISNGAATHQRTGARRPSDASNDVGSAGSSIAPPFPVPVRLSSRKHPRSRDGTQSPTPSKRQNMANPREPGLVRRPTLRRVRSATVISQEQPEQRRRSGSGSSSAAPSSPYGPDSPPYRPPLPLDDITAPRTRQVDRKQSYGAPAGRDRTGSTAVTAVQPTSIVDAIAQTMVGEWMLKYIRRRRSFGMNEARENWEGKSPDDVPATSFGGGGVRHRRWVWLAPYERAIMWSSKQPTTGPALLGKSGRKFAIKSVLDVRDDNPLPKGFSAQNQINRSILILTPQRALKFTASSLDRHFVWLTALSFLSDPTMGMHDLATLPPAPREEFVPPKQPATLRRNPIRDSIKVAKGKSRPVSKGKHSFTSQPPPVPELPPNEPNPTDPAIDAADPPFVPRFSNHARKRSSTMPRPPTIRSFSSHTTMPSWHNAGSSDAYSGFNSGRSSFSFRPSEASGGSSPGPGTSTVTVAGPSAGTGNFFDALGTGTVRMEAFIDGSDHPQFHHGRYHHGHGHGHGHGRAAAQYRSRNFRKPSNYWGQESSLGGSSSLDFLTYEDGTNDMYYRSDGGN